MLLFCTFAFVLLTLITGTFNCYVQGKELKDGEELITNQFVMKCNEYNLGQWKTEIIACLTSSGRRIKVGDTAVEGMTEFRCNHKPGGGGGAKLSQHSHVTWPVGRAILEEVHLPFASSGPANQ